MKVLSVAEMRDIDRRTIAAGIPGLILMENAGCRVVEFLAERFAPLSSQRVVVFCGKGNNGGDGLVVARQLLTRFRPAALYVLLAASESQLSPDAAENLRMWRACGGRLVSQLPEDACCATLVIDALLGTGLTGPPQGLTAELISQINSRFPLARIVAVDIPSGLPGDGGPPPGAVVRAHHTITFTAPKLGQVLLPGCDLVGELIVAPIGTPPEMFEADDAIRHALLAPPLFGRLLAPRAPGAHKGDFGHVLILGGSRGKSGAAAMAGLAALRAGAGLTTVACAESSLPIVASFAPEVMTEPLPECPDGTLSSAALRTGRLLAVTRDKDVLAIGPGLGATPDTAELVRYLLREASLPLVLDADALNVLATLPWDSSPSLRVLTPHPGEMARLTGIPASEIQLRRLDVARQFAQQRGVVLVLKGQRTLIAFPDGRVWINPTGTPAMATGGSGDVLTGLIAGMLAQFPHLPEHAIAAAVYLHGLAGERGARTLGEASFTATDLLRFLPEAFHACRNV